MSNFNDSPHATAIDGTIAKLLEDLDGLSGDSEEYSKTADNLAKLMKLKNESIKIGNDFEIENHKVQIEMGKLTNETEKTSVEREKLILDSDKLDHEKAKFDYEQEKDRSWKPSSDAVVTAAASVLGILLVLHYEKIGIVTSKALGFVNKMK
jgi:hypothetical protein